MKVIFGSDEKTSLTNFISKWLKDAGHNVEEVGHLTKEEKKWKWVDIGKEVGSKVAKGEADFGVVCCWSGTGVCMAANRFRGAMAALCWDSETAKLARKWDNANILCLSLRFTSETIAKEILEVWLSTKFDEEDLNEAHKLDKL
ncbi:MAG: RpiB/LacA/LacB family sugar-phosphate isomerase [Patescibacteria group bacterium]